MYSPCKATHATLASEQPLSPAAFFISCSVVCLSPSLRSLLTFAASLYTHACLCPSCLSSVFPFPLLFLLFTAQGEILVSTALPPPPLLYLHLSLPLWVGGGVKRSFGPWREMSFVFPDEEEGSERVTLMDVSPCAGRAAVHCTFPTQQKEQNAPHISFPVPLTFHWDDVTHKNSSSRNVLQISSLKLQYGISTNSLQPQHK